VVEASDLCRRGRCISDQWEAAGSVSGSLPVRRYVDQLADADWQLDRLSEFPLVLERLRSNIDDPRWQRKVAYWQARPRRYDHGDGG